jgi:hypothetical protein
MKMNNATPMCNHSRIDDYGICEGCGTLTMPFPYSRYDTTNALLELEKDEGIISDQEYAIRKAKLDFIREYCIRNKLWYGVF